jgi:hypothetical protein
MLLSRPPRVVAQGSGSHLRTTDVRTIHSKRAAQASRVGFSLMPAESFAFLDLILEEA